MSPWDGNTLGWEDQIESRTPFAFRGLSQLLINGIIGMWRTSTLLSDNPTADFFRDGEHPMTALPIHIGN